MNTTTDAGSTSMPAMRWEPLDDVGDLNAAPGSRAWSLAILSRMRAALADERMNARHLERWRNRLIEYRGYASLTNEDGEAFPTFEAFCRASEPYGLGYDPVAIDAIIAERKSAQARAAQPKPLAKPGEIGRGRNRGSDRTPKRGENADYLIARLARDHEDILARLQAGEFRSVAAAARTAGILGAPRKRVAIDEHTEAVLPTDPKALGSALAQRYTEAEFTRVSHAYAQARRDSGPVPVPSCRDTNPAAASTAAANGKDGA